MRSHTYIHTCHEGPEEREEGYSSIISSTSAIDAGDGPKPRPGRFTLGKKDPVAVVQDVGWVPVLVWTGVKNLTRTGIRSLYGPSSGESLYRLRFDILQTRSGSFQI
jgi:hypothetical protein